ncbi:cytochrome c biogenesis CcdA family protein [Alteribacter natronophilus]|uniref:cytochrome c biogenesis CcdA family protein n=1 Tax=Alteribacter natronophilus TaxID=2583810 RepID=UPI00110D4C12|nr:cytochrome c biogenesis protein CcdA [Alteribacter natronophilus]TMW72994.1 cytochrome c biogenesis protein CcdA [Alteribacter natronophilus]
MEEFANLTIWAAFAAGVISFISPCTLPLFPAYLSYITGVSVKELEERKDVRIRRQLMTHSFFFLLGASSIFLALGVSATYFGQFLQELIFGQTGNLIQRFAGIFIIFMGLVVSGVIQIGFLLREKRLNVMRKPAGYAGTTFVGVGFAAGWTPCIGPIFASVLLLAASHPAQGLTFTIAYILGFTIPFFVLTFFIGSAKWIVKYSSIIMKGGGALMVLMGVLLFSGKLTEISIFILRLIEGTPFENIG